MSTTIQDTDRQRLVRILGMLGSSSAGERDAAGKQAERLRRQLGKTWEDLVSDRVVYVDSFIPSTPIERVREVVREVPTKPFGLPLWAFAPWVFALGTIFGLWLHWLLACS